MAQDRLYMKPEHGGLGLISINELLIALKCSWFMRILQDGINDSWRRPLMENCYFDLTCFRPEQLTPGNTLVNNIGSDFWTFLGLYWKLNHNFLKAPLVLNTMFCRGFGDNGKVDNKVVDSQLIGKTCFEKNKEKWLGLRVCDMLSNGIIISLPEMNIRLGFDITVYCYLGLRRAVSYALIRYGNNKESDNTSVGINDVLARRAKGAKSS